MVADTTLYAWWTPVTPPDTAPATPPDTTPVAPPDTTPVTPPTQVYHTVTFDLCNGEPAVRTPVHKDSAVPRPADPTRKGYRFAGWCTDTLSGDLWDSTTPVTADLTLYATWTPLIYTVTFEVQGGHSYIPPQQVPHGDLITRPDTPSRSDYLFIGWYTDVVFITPWRFDRSCVTGDTTLFAHWTPAETLPTVITPNGDGINDSFEVPQGLLFPHNELAVFNRAGIMVYHHRAYYNEFDGAGLPEGTYFYLFTYVDDEGKVHKIFDSVWVTRE